MPLERVNRLIAVLVVCAKSSRKQPGTARGSPNQSRPGVDFSCFWLFLRWVGSVELQHFAGLAAALRRADDALFFHHVDQACRAGVADPQAALEHLDRRAP